MRFQPGRQFGIVAFQGETVQRCQGGGRKPAQVVGRQLPGGWAAETGRPTVGGQGPGRGGVDPANRNGEAETASLPQDTVDGDLAPQHLHILAGNGKPQPCSFNHRSPKLLKGVEDAIHIFPSDADAGVMHLDGQYMAIRSGLGRQPDRDLAGGSEFDGVINEIDQDLAKLARVGADQARQFGSRVEDKAQSLGFCTFLHHGDDMAGQFDGIDIAAIDLALARLDLGKIEDVVDQRQQMLATADDDTEALPGMAGNGRIPRHDVGKPENRGERGPQFVRHVGQKHRLGAVGRLRLVSGFGQFRRPLPHQLF